MTEASAARQPLPRGTRVSRYVLLDELPGPGAAYLAYDHQLSRRIVLEFLPLAPAERDHLLGQARALAQLSHPNVLGVYDVGTFDAFPFVAMEFVDGAPLPDWLARGTRSWQEIVPLFVAVARGLAAAHHAGILHGGFAPSKVVIGEGGRPRITGFGLSDAAASAPADHAAYAAPETRAGAVDTAGDQFSFCCVLFEALFGARPFSDEEAGAETRRAPRIPVGSHVPGWLRAILLRGLSFDPAERYPSLDALLVDLARDYGARRRNFAAVAGMLALVAVSALALSHERARRERWRRESARQLAGVWDDSVRARLRGAFAAARAPSALAVVARVNKVLDDYARNWATMRTQAAERSQGVDEQSALLLDRRMACLRRRLGALEALTAVLTDKPDAEVVSNALPAAVGLPPLAACADREALLAAFLPPADPELRARVETIDRVLDRAVALRSAGKYQNALELTRGAAEQTRALDYPRLSAKATVLAGGLQDDLGETKAAEAALSDGLQAAASAKDDVLVARAWVDLIWTVGFSASRSDEAIALAPAAEAAIVRAGNDQALFAELQSHLGVVYWAASRFEEARRCHERALALRTRLFGDQHPVVAKSLTNLGNVYHDLGDYARTEPYYEKALAITERALGPDHPDVARSYANLGANLLDQGKYDAAREPLERALEIYRRALGPNHLWVGVVGVDLGRDLLSRGHAPEAVALEQASLAILEKTLGPTHEYTGGALATLAEALVESGRAAEAVSPATRALEIDSAPSTKPITRARAKFTLARALWSSDKERTRSLTLATAAGRELAQAGDQSDGERRAVDAWLAAHRRAGR